MNTESVRDRFLVAEEEASQIIETLKQLRKEMGQYGDVRKSMVNAVKALEASAQGLAPISVKMKKLLLTLDELGFTQFRDDLTAIGKIVEHIKVDQKNLLSLHGHLLSEVEVAAKERADLTRLVSKIQKDQENLKGLLKEEISKQNKLSWKQNIFHSMTLLLLVLLVALSVV